MSGMPGRNAAGHFSMHFLRAFSRGELFNQEGIARNASGVRRVRFNIEIDRFDQFCFPSQTRQASAGRTLHPGRIAGQARGLRAKKNPVRCTRLFAGRRGPSAKPS